MHKDRGDYRNIAIHLMKKWPSVTNKQIGDLFGGLSFTAFSKANQRFMMRMKKDRKLRRRVDDILKNMVAVGMPVTRHPPRRSQRALLTHWAPASGIDAQPS